MKILNILILLIILLSVSCKQEKKKVFISETKRVRVTEATSGPINIPVIAGGIIVSSEEIKLSFKTGGIIENIYAREGTKVRKGDVLAALNLSEISNQVNQAENAYEKALRDHTRASNLYRDSVATLEQLQNAETAMNLAKSTLDIARFNLVHSKIIAPDNGIILKQLAKTNELIASGYPVFLFGTSGKSWKVKAGIPDREIVKIRPGDSASVTVDAYPGTEFPGRIDQLGEMANPMTGTYEVEILLNETRNRMASGFVASVKIFPRIQKSLLIVPVGAIIEADGNRAYVFVLNGTGTVKKIPVEINALTDSGTAIKGLPGGINQIVWEGAAYLRDGDSVEVVR